MDIWLGETKIPEPSTFNVTEFDIVREGRVASGKLVMDVIATKKRFTLGYNYLTGPEMDAILTEYDRRTFLVLKYTDRAGVDQSYTVKFVEVPRALLFDVGDWSWRDITLQLEEQ